MFPSLLTRLADTALELADAMLAPLPADGPSPDGAPHSDPVHAHRRPLPRANAGVPVRRPGALRHALQPCTSPLPRRPPTTTAAPAPATANRRAPQRAPAA